MCPRCPRLWMPLQTQACTAMCRHGRVCVPSRVRLRNVLVRTSLLHCLRIQSFPIISLANSGGEGESSWLSHQCLECQSQCGSWNLTFVCCQRQATAIQRPTSEWVLLADLHVELQSLFVTSGKLAGWSVHVYNTHPDFERGNYGENCVYYNQIFTVIFSKVRWLHS